MNHLAGVEADLRSRLRQQADRCTARALAAYLPVIHDHLRRSRPPDAVDSFISVLRGAVDRRVGYGNDDLLSYGQALVELITNLGGGDGFRGEEQLLDLFERLAIELSRAGKPTTDLRLGTARYSSLTSNGGLRRKALIDSALSESRTDDERLRALLVMAKYYIDISDYGRAHRCLDECEVLATRAASGPAQLFDVHTTRGIAHFYRSHRLARRSLLRGVSLARALTDPLVCRATATALHFLGRIRAARGDIETALAYLVLAQHYKSHVQLESTQLGYYHLRLGEILSAAGSVTAAYWHLNQAGHLFHNVHQRSTAEAQLTSALAGVAARSGDSRQAEYLLMNAIESARRDSYPRGELRFLLQLLGLQARRGASIAAFRTARRVLRLWRTTEQGSWRWYRGQTRSSTFARSLARRLRRSPVVSCPCLDHDMTPVPDLVRRAGLGVP